jgi:hypothetical protein
LCARAASRLWLRPWPCCDCTWCEPCSACARACACACTAQHSAVPDRLVALSHCAAQQRKLKRAEYSTRCAKCSTYDNMVTVESAGNAAGEVHAGVIQNVNVQLVRPIFTFAHIGDSAWGGLRRVACLGESAHGHLRSYRTSRSAPHLRRERCSCGPPHEAATGLLALSTCRRVPTYSALRQAPRGS